jgi:hypothetical protein
MKKLLETVDRKKISLLTLIVLLFGVAVTFFIPQNLHGNPWYLTTIAGGELLLIVLAGVLSVWVGFVFATILSGISMTNRRFVIINLLFGGMIILFDLLRKTVFQGASWNYVYPTHRYLMSILTVVVLLIVLYAWMLYTPKMLSLSNMEFVGVIYFSTLLIGVMTFLAVPVTTEMMALTPSVPKPSHDYLYYPTTVLIEQGPSYFLANIHELPTLTSTNRRESAQLISEAAAQIEYLPFKQEISAYIAEIETTRHGPVPSFLIAPFLLVLGVTPISAVIGAYILVSFTPIVGYYAFKQYFDETVSRYGSLFLVFSPALYIWLRHKTIPYDALTGLLIGISTYLLLRGVNNRSKRALSGASIVFSLAALSKISVLPLLVPYFLSILFFTDNKLQNISISVLSLLVIPVSLLFFGYNFVAWYIYDIGRITIIESGSYSGATSYLNNQLLAFGSAWYNIRLLGSHVFILLLAVGSMLTKIIKNHDERELIGLSFVIPVLPFLMLSGLTLSRHLLVILVPIVFTLLIAVDHFDLNHRFVQSCIAVSGLLLVINF